MIKGSIVMILEEIVKKHERGSLRAAVEFCRSMLPLILYTIIVTVLVR